MCPKTKFDRVVPFNRNFNGGRERGPKNTLQWTRSIKITQFYWLAQKRARALWDLEGGVVNLSAHVSSTKRHHTYGYVETDNISDL